MAVNNDFFEKLKVLQKFYANELSIKLKRLSDAFEAYKAGKDEAINDLHRIIHGLAGSAATFGFESLCQLAKELDVYIQNIKDKKYKTSYNHKAHIQTLIEKLLSLSSLNLTTNKDLSCFVSSLSQRDIQQSSKTILYLAPFDESHIDRIVSVQTIKEQISYFGYEVHVFSEMDEAIDFAGNQPLSAVIVDTSSISNYSAALGITNKIQKTSKLPLPVIVVSFRSDFEARLQAVRAGCDAYFTMPLDVLELVQKLDELTFNTNNEPYKVLIVDDEVELAQYYSSILQQAEMMTDVVINPLDVTRHLTDFNPDLILMDVYMPECSGLELAAVIRQIKTYTTTPIVFLSIETDIQRQLDAMRLGGDDFLVKPVQPYRLISLLTSRIQRARALKSLTSKDSMTGLFNHSTTKSIITSEVLRAKRQGLNLSVALIDIDHFKKVNDTYGHFTGDNVIKALARLLQQRLRKTDIVGRYGGEEFVVIMPDTEGRNAFIVIDSIRSLFAKMLHYSVERSFKITFSAGVAEFSSELDGDKLIEQADIALYKAKNAGRNRVILYSTQLTKDTI